MAQATRIKNKAPAVQVRAFRVLSIDMIRELSFAERTVWGTCPACGAKHGEPCDASIGRRMIINPSTIEPVIGCHYGRLSRAPFTVIENE